MIIHWARRNVRDSVDIRAGLKNYNLKRGKYHIDREGSEVN
jgi:hypothetical protein